MIVSRLRRTCLRRTYLRWTCAAALSLLAAQTPATPQTLAPPQQPIVAPPAELFAGLDQFAAGATSDSQTTAANASARAALSRATGRPDLVARLDFFSERVVFYAHPSAYNPAALEPYHAVLAAAPWSCFVHTASPDKTVDLCERMNLPAGTHELAEIRTTPEILIFFDARGRISLAELSELSKLAAIPKEQQSR